MMKTLKESLLDDFGEQTADLKHLQIEDWLKKNNALDTDYTINDDYTIDIDRFIYGGKGNFPDYIQFNKCEEDFDLEGCKMTSLRGCPKYVEYIFNCSGNQLKNLEGGPEYAYTYDCSFNELKSLKGAPKEVNGYFYCHVNPLPQKEVDWGKKHIKGRKFVYK